MQKSVRLLSMLLVMLAAAVVMNVHSGITRAYFNDEVDKGVKLVSTGIFKDAKGKAKVENEYDHGTIVEQKLMVRVRKLAPKSSFRILVDGVDTATFTTDSDGKAKVEFKSKLKGSKESRPASLPDASVIEVIGEDGQVVLTTKY